MKIFVDDTNGIVRVFGAFDGKDYIYAIKGLNDMAILHRLDVYYAESIYSIIDNRINNLTPFDNGLYVFLGYEHDQLHFISVDDGNVYTVPVAMHGLRFYFNPNLNSIAREQECFDRFCRQVENPEAGYSDYTWKRKCVLDFSNKH